ncbi:TPA: hypothetical protein U6I48_004831 [Klebsiella aerogenes]|nr:hypothetical protein [Klebsiella aerogenes]
MDINLTLNALVCQRAIDLCYSAAWPENTSIDLLPRAGWVAVCARFDAGELVRLLLRLADAPATPADVSHRLNSAAAKLRHTGATAVVYPGRECCPALPGGNLQLNFPFAGEWLDEDEIQAVAGAVLSSASSICRQVLQESRKIREAVTPRPLPRVFERRTRHFRLVVEECDEENWLGTAEPEDVKRVLDAIMNDGARYCALKLFIVDERDENILSYEVMYDVLRRPKVPPRRWFERGILRKVVAAARAEIASSPWAGNSPAGRG